MRALLRYRGDRRARQAFDARRQFVEAGLTRRDLVQLGLVTTGGVGGGLLLSEKGLAADLRKPSALGALPPLTPFAQPLPILPTLPVRGVGFLSPPPTIEPNTKTNPATNLPFEGRTEDHVSEAQFPAKAWYVTRMAATQARIHPDTRLPPQTFWGFNLGDDVTRDSAISPGPVIVLKYGTPAIVRRYNQLPEPCQNGGFGVPEVSTHYHNFHSGTDSDGGPCDPKQQRFFFRGQYRDYFYNMQYAGWDSTNKTTTDGNGAHGDPSEALGFLWYHDHRVDHTAENTYKGLVGPSIIFNDLDTGNEDTGLHLPSFHDGGGFDIPLVFADKLLDPATGLLAFDTFNFDGLLGNVFLVNGKVQPYFEVTKRRYRFRLLDGGPSRFYQFFLTNPDNLRQSIPFWVLSNDGNLLPRPIKATSYQISVAERTDILVDFGRIAQQFGASRLGLENRLEQTNGRGPTGKILPA